MLEGMTTDTRGPVSAHLEAELREEVRRHGVVLWLDPAGHYTGFVDRLRADPALPYPVRAFRGSYLQLLLALDGLAAGSSPQPLLLHLPGLDAAPLADTPLLELERAGKQHRRALETLVGEAAAGQVRPDRIAAFLARPGLTLEAADAWLAGALAGEATHDLAAALKTMRLPAVVDDLLVRGPLSLRLAEAGATEALWEWLRVGTGLASDWQATVSPRAASTDDIAFAVASWALAVEYVDDLKRAPVSPRLLPARTLPKPLVGACRALATHLRERHPTHYQQMADATEALLADEVAAACATDLGRIDTFRFEEDLILKAALQAVEQARYPAALEWAEARVHRGQREAAGSFWLRRDPARAQAWALVEQAAHLGLQIERAGPRLGTEAGSSLEAAVQAYVERGAAVDQAHRWLEQRRLALLEPRLPEYETLRRVLDLLRQRWREWANGWSLAFNTRCRTTGFLGSAESQQRQLFEQVVRPLTRDGATAYFMVDALRYEMGLELYEQLKDTAASTVRLEARLAELPTVTEVGMNVLAPVAREGRLQPVFDAAAARVLGFQCGEFRVSDPETRKRAMQARVESAAWLSLQEVLDRSPHSLKASVSRARLVVVHSQEIDNAGEKGAGLSTFETVLRQLRSAWQLLRDAGVRRFVITADHGFLLLDDAAATAQLHGRKIDPKRRHVYSPVPADHRGEVRVPLAELGYEGTTDQLMFPDSTAVFDVGKRLLSFVHGGNSLQERVIPVLTLLHRAPPGSSSLRYAIAVGESSTQDGLHGIAATLQVPAQAALDFGRAPELGLALRVLDAPGVQVILVRAEGARIEGGLLLASPDAGFRLHFRLLGDGDARVQVELYHPGAEAEVTPCTIADRFAVAIDPSRDTARTATPAAATVKAGAPRWFEALEDEGVRRVFAHLDAHGVITEAEATPMLGGPRAYRRFALDFERYARQAPYALRIETVGHMKRYVRERTG